MGKRSLSSPHRNGACRWQRRSPRESKNSVRAGGKLSLVERRLANRASVAITAPEASGRRRFISAFISRKRSRASKPRRLIGRKSESAEALSRALGAKNRLNLVSHRCRNSLQGSRRRFCQQPASGRSSRVGVTQISCSAILIDASADRHFNRDMAWEIDS